MSTIDQHETDGPETESVEGDYETGDSQPGNGEGAGPSGEDEAEEEEEEAVRAVERIFQVWSHASCPIPHVKQVGYAFVACTTPGCQHAERLSPGQLALLVQRGVVQPPVTGPLPVSHDDLRRGGLLTGGLASGVRGRLRHHYRHDHGGQVIPALESVS